MGYWGNAADMFGKRKAYDPQAASASVTGQRLAAQLRETREAHGFELLEVAAQLRLRPVYLEAIEAGRFEDLPGTTYAIGFLRSYAEYLGLDPEQIVASYKQEVAGSPRRSELYLPTPVPEGRLPGGTVLLGTIVLAGIVYGGWYYLSATDRNMADLVPALPDRLVSLLDNLPFTSTTHPLSDAEVAEALARAQTSIAPLTTEPKITEVTVPDAGTVAPTAAAPEPVPPGPAPVVTAEETPASAPAPTPASQVASLPVTGTGGSSVSPAAPVAPAPVADPEPVATSAPAPVVTTPPAAAVPVPAPVTTAPAAPPAHAGTVAPTPAPAAPTEKVEAIVPPEEEESEGTTQAPTPLSPQAVALAPPPPPPPVPAVEAEAAAQAGKVYGSQNQTVRLQLKATQDSWIQVRDGDGQIVFTRVLKPNDVYRVPDRPGMRVRTGNAGGLIIVTDGVEGQPMGAVGQVLRDVALDNHLPTIRNGNE